MSVRRNVYHGSGEVEPQYLAVASHQNGRMPEHIWVDIQPET